MSEEAINISIFQKQLDITNIVNRKTWEHVVISHGKQYYAGKNDKEIASNTRKTAKKILGEKLKNQAGLYMYYKQDECLYIGKAKKLVERINNHLKESCGIWHNPKWEKFFTDGKHVGELDLYLFPLGGQDDEGEALRRICEELLTLKWEPKFWYENRSSKNEKSEEGLPGTMKKKQ